MMRARRIIAELAPPIVGIAVLVAVWAIVASVTDTQAIPSPGAVWSSFVEGLKDGTLLRAAGRTLVRLVFSFAVAVALGIAVGLVLSLHEFTRRAVRPIVVALQITPFVAWVPLAVVWFPAMALATLQAVRQVPPLYERAGRTLGATGFTLYRRIVLPAALPGVMAGLQQAWGFAWKALMAGELIVATAGATGLGHLLARQANDVTSLLATLAMIVVIGVAADYLLFGQLDRRIRGRRGLLPGS
jgi:sulfonate transport system permease protein